MNEQPTPRLARDDEAPVMSMNERAAWLQLTATVVTSIGYAVVVVPRVLQQPVAEVSWVTPLLWALGVSIALVVVGSIVSGIGSAFWLHLKGRDVDAELGSDFRDRDIELYARRRAFWLLAIVPPVAIMLSMMRADVFWIAHAVLIITTAYSLTETVIQLRAYRKGFQP